MNGATTNNNSTDAKDKVQSGIVVFTPEFGDPIEGDVRLATTSNVFYGFYGYGRYYSWGAKKNKLETILKGEVNTDMLTKYWDKLKAGDIHNQSIANLCVYSALLIDQNYAYVKEIQGVLDVDMDGQVGKKTLAAINEYDKQDLFQRLLNKWESYHKSEIEKSENEEQKGHLTERMNKLYNLIKFKEGEAIVLNEAIVLKAHKGYDYAADIGTKVIAVRGGDVVRVRFGRRSIDKECKHCESIQNNFFDFSKCYCSEKGTGCPYRGECFGIQVWLKIEGSQLYAFYAHLSKLDEKIHSELKDKSVNKYGDININVKIVKGEVIGYSGRTGNVSDKTEKNCPSHLHFECRKGNGKEIPENDPGKETQISPNNIVHTKFYIKEGNESVFNDEDETKKWSEISSTLHRKWKKIRDDIRKYSILSEAESVSVAPIKDFNFMEKEQCPIKNATRTTIKSESIKPYSIVKIKKEELMIENYDDACDNLTDRMPWRNDLSESCQRVSSNNPTNKMPWQNK